MKTVWFRNDKLGLNTWCLQSSIPLWASKKYVAHQNSLSDAPCSKEEWASKVDVLYEELRHNLTKSKETLAEFGWVEHTKTILV